MAKENLDKDNFPLDDEWISRLMEDKLSEAEAATFYANTDNDEMLADAVEGLHQYESIQHAKKQAHDVNRQLLDQLKSNTSKHSKQPLSMSTIVWGALLFIIVLALIGFYLVKMKGL